MRGFEVDNDRDHRPLPWRENRVSVYYNDNDPYCAQMLRNLIKAGQLPKGEVDERSIVEVSADDIRGFKHVHLFAGIGGWPLALHRAGWPIDREVITASCPCQPFSTAGNRLGFKDPRHLWPYVIALIRERRFATFLGEQVANATEWLAMVRGQLEALGYAVGAIPIEAASAGAFQLRDRFFIVARGENANDGSAVDASIDGQKSESGSCVLPSDDRGGVGFLARWPIPVDEFPLLVDGFPERMDQTRAFGNAIVPQVAQAFVESVMECMPTQGAAP